VLCVNDWLCFNKLGAWTIVNHWEPPFFWTHFQTIWTRQGSFIVIFHFVRSLHMHTVLKTTGLLSCLMMKIVCFRMKPKWMWCLREVRLKIPRRSPLSAEMNDASACRTVAQFVMTLFATMACVMMIQNKTCSNHMCLNMPVWKTLRSRHADQRLWQWFVAPLSKHLCYLWRIGLAATSPTCWEACLPWMNPGWMSPAWGCSIGCPIWGVAHAKNWKFAHWIRCCFQDSAKMIYATWY